MDKPFSQILIEYKDKNSLTQKEMSLLLGISERMYNYYEKGDYDGSPKKINKYLMKLSGNGNNLNSALENCNSMVTELKKDKETLLYTIELQKKLLDQYEQKIVKKTG